MSKLFYTLVFIFFTHCYTTSNSQMLVRVGTNSVERLNGNEYSIVYNGKHTILKDVCDIAWLRDDPYFSLTHGRILKWDKNIADETFAFNLQKVWGAIYFLKQYAVGAEPCSVSLNIIDSTGYREIVVKKNGKPEIFEDYFVRYPGQIYVIPWGEYFALIDSVGNVIKTYDLNK